MYSNAEYEELEVEMARLIRKWEMERGLWFEIDMKNERKIEQLKEKRDTMLFEDVLFGDAECCVCGFVWCKCGG